MTHPETFNYPAFTVEAEAGLPVRVKWTNDLVDERGDYLPHLLPVDSTLHWANPPGGQHGRDSRPAFGSTPGPYAGPVPIVTHLHGGHTSDESDGFAEAWYLPRARNIPHNFARVGSHHQRFRTKFQGLHGQALLAGRCCLPVRQRPAGIDALVPRLHAGHDAPERVRRPRRLLPAPRARSTLNPQARSGTGARRLPRHALLRNSTGHPGPIVQHRWLPLLPG